MWKRVENLVTYKTKLIMKIVILYLAKWYVKQNDTSFCWIKYYDIIYIYIYCITIQTIKLNKIILKELLASKIHKSHL